MITVSQAPFADPGARALWDAQQVELAARYGEEDIDSHLEDVGIIASLVGATADGEAVATALLRWSPYETGPGTAEVKRLYVAPEHRGHGHSRVMMGEVERLCRAVGATRLVLETGIKQPEAMALYEAIGYARTEKYGQYKDHEESVCYDKHFPTRVLVVNGTMGAGKTTVAAAAHDLLAERGARVASIDGDALCQADPWPEGDRFNQGLFFAALGGAAPAYRERGYGLVVLPRVVEDPADRDRFARAFASAAGPAEVAIVRVTAPEAERIARLSAREPEGKWRDFALARTVELEAALDGYGLDDAVVENSGIDRLEAAARVLDAAGWI